jgi:hypothetical protein
MQPHLHLRLVALPMIILITAVAGCSTQPGPGPAVAMPTPDPAITSLAQTVAAVAVRAETAESLAATAAGQAATADALAMRVATSLASITPTGLIGSAVETTTTLPSVSPTVLPEATALFPGIGIITQEEGTPRIHIFPIAREEIYSAYTDVQTRSLDVELVISGSITGTHQLFYNQRGQLANVTSKTWQWTTFTISTPLTLSSAGEISLLNGSNLQPKPILSFSAAHKFNQAAAITPDIKGLAELILEQRLDFEPVIIVYRIASPEPGNGSYGLLIFYYDPNSPGPWEDLIAWCNQCVDGTCKYVCWWKK